MHSVVPSDLIWAGIEEIKPRKTMMCNGIMVEAEELEPGSYRILRLLNAKTADYLDKRLQPGQIWKR